VLVLEHLYNMDFEDFALQVFYNSTAIGRLDLKK
jgi:hypothetical protein